MTPRVVLATVAVTLVCLPARAVDFSRDVRPILATHCFNCHGRDEKTREAGLRLDDRAAALAELPSGETAIVPGDPGKSGLVARIESTAADVVMPPPHFKKPLDSRQIATLKQWIAEGAAYAPHWAFQPIGRPEPPAVPTGADAAWPRNEIDRFVLGRLAREGLAPAAEASRDAWLRRVTLDLTGLPPTPAERDAFLADTSPAAHEAVVDRLLASPRHAERMAMHWLDLARYSDTNGFNNDEERTQWPWRDWVIDAFAKNMPYDQFIVEQLAGDQLPNATQAQRIATAFGRNHVLNTEGGIVQEEYRVEYVADRIQTVATAFMGLSLQCARCHDHKFDPLTQREYFQLYAFFNSIPDAYASHGTLTVVAEPTLKLRSPADEEQVPGLEAEKAGLGRRKGELEKLLADEKRKLAAQGPPDAAKQAEPLETPQAKELADVAARLAAVTKQFDEIDARTTKVMVLQDLPRPRSTQILDRGKWDAPGAEVQPGVPAALPPLPAGEPATRLALARWLVRAEHPLTARVAVNRFWEMFFGRGLVETSEDFGQQGSPPTHPELLDHLAGGFIDSGWNVRRLLREIVLSATYRQASAAAPESFARDPDNRLLARGPRFRLPAEMVRDQALAASGLLIGTVGGPSVRPWQPEGLWEEVSVSHRAKYVPDMGEGLFRRSMYTFWKRTCPPPSLSAFDAPDREFCVVRRSRTTTPLQSLVLMNDPTYVEAARKLAARAVAATNPGGAAPGRGEDADRDRRTISALYAILLCRAPTVREAGVMVAKLGEFRSHFRADPAAARALIGMKPDADVAAADEQAAWTMLSGMLLCLDETITKG